MTFLTQLAQSTLAARLACIVLLAALAGLVTDAFLKITYGAPAPAAAPLISAANAKPTPNWLAGAASASIAPSDLKLLGVIAQGPTGIALVQQTGKRAQVLRVGQSLADGTQLKSVSGKTATVQMNQTLKTLTLDAIAGKTATIAMSNAPSAPIIPMPDASAQVSQQMQQLQQAVANEAQASALNESGSLKKRVGARP